jgi:hypothetical protein
MVVARRRVVALARVQVAIRRGACLRVDVAVCVVVVGIRDGGGATGQQACRYLGIGQVVLLYRLLITTS